MLLILFKTVKGILKCVSNGLFCTVFAAEWLGIQRNIVSFWSLILFNLASNFAISRLFNFFLDFWYGRLAVRKYYVFRVPVLGDQCQVYCIDHSAENRGFCREMILVCIFPLMMTAMIFADPSVTIWISSSSSYRAGSTDIPDPLSPLLPIVHRPR